MCVKGIPSSFLRHTTIKLFKGSDYECIILAISMMDILGQKEILHNNQILCYGMIGIGDMMFGH
jgi:hypothetical protein